MVSKENDMLVAENQGLSDPEIMQSIGKSKILDQCEFKDPIIQHAETMEFPNRYNAAHVYETFRGDSIYHLRGIECYYEM